MSVFCTINIIHLATVESGYLPQTRYKPRPWCPELSEIRDKKRYRWWLWVDNDRPRTGQVFKCYKYVNKLFRRMCRSRVQGIQLNYYTKTAGLFKNGKISNFWSRIHSRRHKRVPPRVEATQMSKYYAGRLSCRIIMIYQMITLQ